ncbi:hypothetical protein [Streptomyces caatingaensis]|uniref:hypothetical protein n=1 Tax=Streptomyces caatingaensis TaxID=1678637 RepID=UPI000AC971F1|nr:hypothetical protein [Streptomyces caatingaensis]
MSTALQRHHGLGLSEYRARHAAATATHEATPSAVPEEAAATDDPTAAAVASLRGALG